MRLRSDIIWTALALTVAVAPAAAQVNCGDTIIANTVITAADPIVAAPCYAQPALTVVGPAKLDLGSHTIICGNPANTGIILEGAKAKLSNGSAISCSVGVFLFGTGGHQLENVVVWNSTLGFDAPTDNNKLRSCVAHGNSDRGFVVSGSGNKIRECLAIDNGSESAGFDIAGQANKLQDNVSARNGQGFSCSAPGSANHSLKGNIAAANNNDDFFWACAASKLADNTAIASVEDGAGAGINIGTSDVKLLGNRSVGSGADGFALSGSNIKMIKNTSVVSAERGIALEATGTGGLQVSGNRSFSGNGGDIAFLGGGGPGSSAKKNVTVNPHYFGGQINDAQEPPCTDMQWRANVFYTPEAPACVE